MKLKSHFERISKNFGFEVKADEEMINSLGYQFLMMQQMEKAEGLFLMNIDLYPDHANVYDSAGDYYAAAGERLKAIESYKKAQTIEYNDYTEAKLKALEQ